MDYDTLNRKEEVRDTLTVSGKKKISIIIPCYNVELTIDRCMESIVKQTIGIDSLEIILVNDASTDRTFEKLCEWEAKYTNSIMVVNCKENKKPGGARNIGMKYVSGKYIGFVDADDVLEENMFEILYKAVTEECDLAICQSSREIVCDRKKEPKKEIIEIISNQERRAFLERNYNMAVWNKIYLHDFLLENDIKFIEGVIYEDIYFSELVKRCCKKVYVTDEILYHHILNEKSISCDVNNKVNRINYIEVQIALIEELQRRKLYEPFGDLYANKFIIHFISFMKSYEMVFGKMDKELENIIFDSVKALYPDYKKIPIVKSIMDAGQEENRKMLKRLGNNDFPVF